MGGKESTVVSFFEKNAQLLSTINNIKDSETYKRPSK
jgi:hypothetical protein